MWYNVFTGGDSLKKKVIIAVIVAILAILILNPFSLWLISELFTEAARDTALIIGESKAYDAALNHLTTKYDGKYGFHPSNTDSYYYPDGDGSTTYTNDDQTIFVTVVENNITCYDTYQNDEILQAVKEYYFTDPELGDLEYLDLELSNSTHGFSDYFDGDIRNFIDNNRNNHLCIDFTVLYKGNEKDAELYNEKIRDKMIWLANRFDSAIGGIFIRNPNADTSSITNGDNFTPYFEEISETERENSVYISTNYFPSGTEFLSLYAGITNKSLFDSGEKHFFAPVELKEIDEFTAIACDTRKITFARNSKVDIIPALRRGNYDYNPRPEETPIQLHDKIYRIEFEEPGENFALLRLDMEHYGLTPDTVPLCLTQAAGKWEGELHYSTFGYTGKLQNEQLAARDMANGGWYCYDEKYMYIMVTKLSDGFLGFADKNTERNLK